MAARTYSTDEVIAMMQAPREDVQMLEKPASPFLDPAQINAAERELSQPPPEYPRPDNVGAAITDAAGIDRPAGSSGNMALQNYEAQEVFPIDQTPAPQRPKGGSALLYPSKQETQPQIPKPVYSTDEVMALYTNESQPVYSTQDVMKQMITPLYDPTAKRPTRDEYFKLKEMEKSLKESGDIEDPGAFEIGLKAVGGVLVTAADALATATFKVDPKDAIFTVGGVGVNPGRAIDDTLKRKDATVRLAGEYVKQQYNALSQGLAAIGGPKYRVKETGEFITSMQQAMNASKMGQAGGLARVPAADDSALIDRYKQQGLTLVPVGDEDLKDWEYMQWNQKMDRNLSIHEAANTPRPPDVLYRLAAGLKPAVTDYFTGRNDYADAVAPVLANEPQANLLSMGVDPMVWATSGAGAATRLGISAAAKGATAETLGIMGKLAQKAVKPTEAALTRTEAFKRLVVSPAKVASAYGAAQGVAWAADKLELPSELKTAAFTAASLYGAYKAGVGVLRFTANKLPEASVILRESANATNGFDAAARKAVANNADVPYSIRERLLRPSQFVAMESTPARLAKNTELSPGTRAMMDKLSNWYVVQGVRGASAVTTGAVKGTAASVPFAELMRSAGDEESADAIYGMGAGFGAAGGAASRVMGARGRRYAQAESDIARFLTDVQGNTTGLKDVKRYNWIDTEIGRLLTDVELGAGDVSALVKNRSFDELARTAAMQGFFRDRVDFVPLNAADFALNTKGHGADGSAGYFLNAPEGERPRIFVNVESRRADVEPHEFYEAFFSSDAFSPEQKASMRAAVDQRYGADGLMARGREYAEQLIKAENSKNFPNENLVVTGDQIAIKMDQLAQDELGRGGQDSLDWVRREVMVEEARLAGVDYAAMRRNVPAGQNPINFIENLLGANARALGLSGVRVDPETGMAVTPEQLFKENPVAANDPKLVKQLNSYLKTYKQWLNDPQHEAPKGTRIAPDGRAESLANNPNVKFYDGVNGKENSIAFVDASGRVVEKTPKQRAKERKLRGQQIRNMVGSKILEPANPIFGLKKWANGRIRAGGKRLPDVMALQTHWKAHLPVIRSIEALSDSGESQQVLYFAKGNSADKVKSSRLSDIDAINREMVFDQWTTNASGDLLAQFLDLTSVRNRAMKAIAERHPALDPANGGPGYKLQAIMDDVNQWMADKGAGKAGEATIGVPRKNVVNALINPGTNFNRGKNDLAGAFGRGSAIKTLLLEGINAVSGTGRKGAAMDYNWANGNFMPDKPAPRPDMEGDLAPPRMPQQIPREAQGMPDAPRRYVPMEKFIEEAGDDLGAVLANAYADMDINEDRNALVGFVDTRNSMYRQRIPVKEFFDWLHSDEPMRGLVFDSENKPATAGEGASYTREGYEALLNRLRDISLRKPKPSAAPRGQAMPDAVSADAPPFYMKSAQVLDAKIQGKAATADQVRAILKNPQNGIKAEELKWTGIEQAVERIAKENGGKVPKEALLRYLKEDGAVRLEEVTLKESGTKRNLANEEQLGRLGYSSEVSEDGLVMAFMDLNDPSDLMSAAEMRQFGLPAEAVRLAETIEQSFYGSKGSARYGSYQLPGGENYREVVLAMPPIGGGQVVPHPEGRGFAIQYKDGSFEGGSTPTRWDSRGAADTGMSFYKNAGGYTSTHFDTPNYVAHMRLNERTDAAGKRGLFLEEIQSDRHQAGRDKGYLEDRDPKAIEAAIKEEERLSGELQLRAQELRSENGFPAELRKVIAMGPEAKMRHDAIRDADARYVNLRDGLAAARLRRNSLEIDSNIPDAPFRKDWPMQMFKRALRDAVESGRDWIGWTTGETQAARYDLSQQVNSIEWKQESSGSRIVTLETRNSGEIMFEVSPDGKTSSMSSGGSDFDGKTLDAVVGKEVAEKIMSGAQGDLRGAGLKIGGEGMKGFYDQILPKEISKYVKQWGGQVEKANIRTKTTFDPSQTTAFRIVDRNGNDAGGNADRTMAQRQADQLSQGQPERAPFTVKSSEQEITVPIWRVSITPQMRESIKKAGQALFVGGAAAVVAEDQLEQ